MHITFSNADLVEMVKKRVAEEKFTIVKVPDPVYKGEAKYEVLFKTATDGVNAVVEVKLTPDSNDAKDIH